MTTHPRHLGILSCQITAAREAGEVCAAAGDGPVADFINGLSGHLRDFTTKELDETAF